MRLQAKVIELLSGSEFPDGIPRATLKVGDAEPFYNTIRVPNPKGWELDELVEVELFSERHTVDVVGDEVVPKVERRG
jgi:hypothetical protein